jgi:hypothetical protein
MAGLRVQYLQPLMDLILKGIEDGYQGEEFASSRRREWQSRWEKGINRPMK